MPKEESAIGQYEQGYTILDKSWIQQISTISHTYVYVFPQTKRGESEEAVMDECVCMEVIDDDSV